MKRFETHCHSHYSNIRLLDSTNKLEGIIARAKELDLERIALTDHECLSGAVKFYKIAKEQEMKIALGNEIYLTDTRDVKQKYFHFILIAKDKIGFRQLRELSSESWMNSYYDRGLERVPTLKSELTAIVKKNPGHLIATSACLGSEFGYYTLEYKKAKQIGNDAYAEECLQKIFEYYDFCINLFKNDFYFEIAPGLSEEQQYYNKMVVSYADKKNVKVVIGTDAHYLTKADRYVHKAFLNSKGGEREVDDFYEFAYLQDENDIKKNLSDLANRYDEFCQNSLEASGKVCDDYELLHPQQIPMVPVKEYPKKENELNNYPILSKMYKSDNIYDRYWINQCCDKLKELNKFNDEYLKELEEEARVKSVIGGKLNTNIFAYPITLQYYINMMWDSGSTIGAGRGSSCAGLNHYLLGVTQLDPIQWKLPFFRYLNEERTELPDIDIDLAPSKRPIILQKIKEERSQRFVNGLSIAAKQNLGCTLVATFGTTSSKSAIMTACRGYTSEEYQDGLDTDIAQYLSSLVPVERGFVWSIQDLFYGDKEKGREPVQTFINEVSKYPGLKDILIGIEGLIDKRGSHASGVIFYDEDPYQYGCFMKTPNGEVETQFDLHDSEAMGLTKFDFLVTDVQDKIVKCIEFLQEFNEIDKNLSLREVYNKYLHPNVLNLNDEQVWSNIQENNILSLFQFDSPVGSQGIEKVHPKNINELNATNGLIRLMPEKGQESPMDKYIRFKDSSDLWTNEMVTYGLNYDEQESFRKYLDETCGIGISQEQLMKVLMDKDLGCFSLAEANDARKTIAKKQMDKIEVLHKLIQEKAKNKNIASYIWDAVVRPQTGYSFSTIHSLAYAIIAYQTALLATKWNSIYWNTSCLVVNSGSLESDIESDKQKGVNYAKLATAIGAIQQEGINVSLVNINTSDFSFEPDVKNNRILYGLNGVTRVNAEMIDMIKQGRPYKNLKDFMNRCPLGKLPMINLIKAGAFEEVDNVLTDRYKQMAYYINYAAEPKKKLTMQNLNGLVTYNVLPIELDNERKLFNYNQYLKKFCAEGENYIFDDRAYNYFNTNFSDDIDRLEVIDNKYSIDKTVWKNLYDNRMVVVKKYINEHQDELLKQYNYLLFKECWDKYAQGNLSKWEMDSLCFYNGPHELAGINYDEYDLVDYYDIEPERVEKFFRKNDINIPIYRLYTIVGTVIAKNDTRHVVSLLTPSCMVNVKFSREYYAEYKSRLKYEGKIVEDGWFTKGTKIMVTGYRRGEDEFVCKTYSKTKKHQLYKITKIYENGNLDFVHERFKADGVQAVEEENVYE